MQLTPDLLLRAYRMGVFPMGEPATGRLTWHAPDPRGVLPLGGFHVPASLARLVRQRRFRVTSDRAFEAVVRACADRPATWITEEIIQVYAALHRQGRAHSVECWQEGRLAGGLYGVALGGAFFGESMFHRASNASKVALVHLVQRLRRGGYVLLDTQYVTPHLEQFGAEALPHAAYERRLARALRTDATWTPAEEAGLSS